VADNLVRCSGGTLGLEEEDIREVSSREINHAARGDKAAASDGLPPPPLFPYSDMLFRWLNLIAGETSVITVEKGGIKAMLGQEKKWDWSLLEGAILPMMEDMQRTLTEFHKEISHALEQRKK
jgi:hypothetical protein